MAIKIKMEDLPSALKDMAGAAEFAGVVALTRTALICRKEAKESMAEKFTMRNKYSPRSVRFTPATIKKKEAEVYVLDPYLAAQEKGLSRPSKPGGVNIPGAIRKAAGVAEEKVIPRGLRRNALVGRGTRTDQTKKGGKRIRGNLPFYSDAFGHGAVYVRKAGGASGWNLLYNIETRPRKTRKRPWYQKVVDLAFDKNIEPQYDIAIDEQIERFSKKYI